MYASVWSLLFLQLQTTCDAPGSGRKPDVLERIESDRLLLFERLYCTYCVVLIESIAQTATETCYRAAAENDRSYL